MSRYNRWSVTRSGDTNSFIWGVISCINSSSLYQTTFWLSCCRPNICSGRPHCLSNLRAAADGKRWMCKSLSLIQTPGSRHHRASLFLILKIQSVNLITRLTHIQWQSKPREDYFIKKPGSKLWRNTFCSYWHWEMGENKECRSPGSDGESPGRLMSETEKWIFSVYCVILLQITESRPRAVYLHTAGLGAAGRRRGTRSGGTGAAPSSVRAGNSPLNCEGAHRE